MLRNTGSVPIAWYVVGPNNVAEMDTPANIPPGGAKEFGLIQEVTQNML